MTSEPTYSAVSDTTRRTITLDVAPGECRMFSDGYTASREFAPISATVVVTTGSRVASSDGTRVKVCGYAVKKDGTLGVRAAECEWSDSPYARRQLVGAPQWVQNLVAAVTA